MYIDDFPATSHIARSYMLLLVIYKSSNAFLCSDKLTPQSNISIGNHLTKVTIKRKCGEEYKEFPPLYHG